MRQIEGDRYHQGLGKRMENRCANGGFSAARRWGIMGVTGAQDEKEKAEDLRPLCREHGWLVAPSSPQALKPSSPQALKPSSPSVVFLSFFL